MKLATKFVVWTLLVGIAEKVVKVRGQRARSSPDHLSYNGGGMHLDGVTSMLTCFSMFVCTSVVCNV